MRSFKKIIVTRYPALAQAFVDMGLCEPGTPVLRYASREDVRGKEVFGSVPVYIAEAAVSLTELPIVAGGDRESVMLDVDKIKRHSRSPVTYVVKTINR